MSLTDLKLSEIKGMSLHDLKTHILQTKDANRPPDEEFEDLGKPELERLATNYIKTKLGISDPPKEEAKEEEPKVPSSPHTDFPNVTVEESENPIVLFKRMGFEDKNDILVQIDAYRRESRSAEVRRSEADAREAEAAQKELELDGRIQGAQKKFDELGERKIEVQKEIAKLQELRKKTAQIELSTL
jgi:hypothetical protein